MVKSLEKHGEVENYVGANPESEDGKESLEGKEHISVDVFRHSGPPFYQLNKWIPTSRDPESAPDAMRQWFYSDLPPEGLELARKKAEEYFDARNPETGELLRDPAKDYLFFVSSDLVRAAETARIFLEAARERGFEIIKPRSNETTHIDYREKRIPRNRFFKNHAEEIGEGWIRKIDCLTLDHLENMLREWIFDKKDVLSKIVNYPGAVSEETKEMWVRARKIIEEGGVEDTWGKNYAKFAEKFVHIGSPVYYICTALKNLGVKEVDAYANYGKEDKAWVEENLKGINIHHFFAEKTLHGNLGYSSDNPDVRTHTLFDYNNAIEPTDELISELEKFDYIIFGPLLSHHIPFQFYEKLKHKNLVYGNFGAFAYLENGKKIHKNPENLIKVLTFVKYLFLDNNEAMFVSGKKSVKEAGKFLINHGLKNAAITEASRGSHLFIGKDYYKIPAFPPKKVVDATGAGDTYLAAYICATELFDDPEQHGRFAAMVAAMSLEKEGAFDRSLEEVMERLRLEK